jgi:hypothetical protein
VADHESVRRTPSSARSLLSSFYLSVCLVWVSLQLDSDFAGEGFFLLSNGESERDTRILHNKPAFFFPLSSLVFNLAGWVDTRALLPSGPSYLSSNYFILFFSANFWRRSRALGLIPSFAFFALPLNYFPLPPPFYIPQRVGFALEIGLAFYLDVGWGFDLNCFV